jgi:hypothetical protein
LPHWPQFRGSVESSTHAPSGQIVPQPVGPQLQCPSLQVYWLSSPTNRALVSVWQSARESRWHVLQKGAVLSGMREWVVRVSLLAVSCTGGRESPQCVPSGPCDAPVFDADAGGCVDASAADGMACDAGLVCQTNTRCLAGACVGDPISCDDQNLCMETILEKRGGSIAVSAIVFD